ncbi:MAG: hypothetical protein ABGX05_15740, partial [Pirellulaceae bacterium]
MSDGAGVTQAYPGPETAPPSSPPINAAETQLPSAATGSEWRETVSIPGLRLVDHDESKIMGQRIYIHPYGIRNLDYDGPIFLDEIHVWEFEAPSWHSDDRIAILEDIKSQLDAAFYALDIRFVFDRPPAELEGQYSTLYVGAGYKQFLNYGEVLGVSQRVDVGNQYRDDWAIVFSDQVERNSTSDAEYSQLLYQTISRETGRLLGYANAIPRPASAGVLWEVANQHEITSTEATKCKYDLVLKKFTCDTKDVTNANATPAVASKVFSTSASVLTLNLAGVGGDSTLKFVPNGVKLEIAGAVAGQAETYSFTANSPHHYSKITIKNLPGAKTLSLDFLAAGATDVGIRLVKKTDIKVALPATGNNINQTLITLESGAIEAIISDKPIRISLEGSAVGLAAIEELKIGTGGDLPAGSVLENIHSKNKLKYLLVDDTAGPGYQQRVWFCKVAPDPGNPQACGPASPAAAQKPSLIVVAGAKLKVVNTKKFISPPGLAARLPFYRLSNNTPVTHLGASDIAGTAATAAKPGTAVMTGSRKADLLIGGTKDALYLGGGGDDVYRFPA